MIEKGMKDIPDWLDRSRRRASRRWAKMTPDQVAEEINRRGREALRLLEPSPRVARRRVPHHSA